MNRIAPPYHPERPKVVVFGGGKGGAGRSTLTAEIARSLARQSALKILCVDASWSCPTLHTFLNASPPYVPLVDADGPLPTLDEPGSHIADFICQTAHAQIHLAALAHARAYPFTRPELRASTLIAQLHELDFQIILVDLGPGLDPFHVALFALSDVPMLVCSPEPAAVRVTTQFLRAVIAQSLSLCPVQRPPEREALSELIYALPLDFNLAALRHMAAADAELAALVEATLEALETYLIINLVREGAERDLGFVLSHAWFKDLGTFPRFLTPVDYEDRRWFYNRRHAGVGHSRGDEALSHDIEQVMRALMQIEHTDERSPRPIPTQTEELSPALQLGLHPDTHVNSIRQHCRRIWEGYRRETTVSLAFRDPEDRARLADSIEHLYRRAIPLPGEPSASTPIGASQRDASSGARGSIAAAPPARRPAAAPPRSRSAGRLENGDPVPLPEIKRAAGAADGITGEGGAALPGQLIERLRQEHAMSLQELSQRTHIGLKYLTAIEEVDFNVLPRSVYLRGYLREIARLFMVDPDQLVLDYFRLLEQSGLGEVAP